MLPLQFRVQVGVELVNDGSELVDEFPHRQRSFSSLQDEEDRSQMELDVALDGVGDVGLDLGVQGALQDVLRDGHDTGRSWRGGQPRLLTYGFSLLVIVRGRDSVIGPVPGDGSPPGAAVGWVRVGRAVVVAAVVAAGVAAVAPGGAGGTRRR